MSNYPSTKRIELSLHNRETVEQEQIVLSKACPIDMLFLPGNGGLDGYNPVLTTIMVPNYTNTSSTSPLFSEVSLQAAESSGVEGGRRHSLQWDTLSQLFEDQNFNLSDDPFEPVPIGSEGFYNCRLLQ
jgi:hypothetical protein